MSKRSPQAALYLHPWLLQYSWQAGGEPRLPDRLTERTGGRHCGRSIPNAAAALAIGGTSAGTVGTRYKELVVLLARCELLQQPLSTNQCW